MTLLSSSAYRVSRWINKRNDPKTDRHWRWLMMPTEKHCAEPMSLASFGVPQLAANKESAVMLRNRMSVYYSGRVQGVGFRYTVKNVAMGFEVNGTVRNLTDGRVELVVEGSKSELEAFRAAIRESGVTANIRHEDVIWSDARGEFRGFEIVR